MLYKKAVTTMLILFASGAVFAQEAPAAIDPLPQEEVNLETEKKSYSSTYALFEMSAILGSGVIWYNLEHSNKKDQYYDTSGAIFRRFATFDAWRYDSNLFETNNIGHPAAGMLYYLTARTNGYSRFESYLFGIGGSAVWEYICEMHEVVSINDMIMTPFGGAAIAEPIYQLTSHIGKENNCGISDENKISPFAATFPLSIGYGYNGRGYTTLGTDYEAVNCDNFSPARSYAGFINDTMSSRINFSSGIANNKIEYIKFKTASMLAGFAVIENRYTQNYSAGLLSGLNSSFTYEYHHYGDFTDKIGTAHLLGMSYAGYYKNGKLYFLADGVVYFDFSSINSYGLKSYLNEGHTMTDVEHNGAYETSLNGYYYAIGSTVQARISAGYGKFNVTIEGYHSYYRSLDTDGNVDQEKKTGRNFIMSDYRQMLKCTCSYQLIPSQLAVQVAVEGRSIWGSAGGESRSGKQGEYQMALAYTGI